MRSICYAKATYYGMGFPPNFGGVTIFLFAALAPWPVFLQKAVIEFRFGTAALAQFGRKQKSDSRLKKSKATGRRFRYYPLYKPVGFVKTHCFYLSIYLSFRPPAVYP